MAQKVRFKTDYLAFKKGTWHTVTDRFASILAKEKKIYDPKDKEDKEDKGAAGRETK
jgi:hypothetical protein